MRAIDCPCGHHIESAGMVFALSGIGLVASSAARPPFDHLFNQALTVLMSGWPRPSGRRPEVVP